VKRGSRRIKRGHWNGAAEVWQAAEENRRKAWSSQNFRETATIFLEHGEAQLDNKK
jgi:hypothetical protein